MAGRGRGMTLPAWMQKEGMAVPQGQPAGSNGPESMPPSGPTMQPSPMYQQPPAARGPPAMHMGGQFMQPQGMAPPSAPIQAYPQAPVAPLPSPANEWKEFKDPKTGRPYYHSSVTKVTTYEKPDSLKTPAERALGVCKWKEYPTADGKMYYSDGKSSVWEEPQELKEYKEKLKAFEETGGGGPAAVSAIAPTVSVSAPTQQQLDAQRLVQEKLAAAKPKPKQIVVDEASLNFNTDEERIEAFFAMLRDHEIASNRKWPEVSKICKDDPRWNALKTTGMKKQKLAEYQTKRMKEERVAKRERARRAKENFMTLLAENTFIDMRTRWRDAKDRLADDDRFKALDDDREREDIFNEFVTELARREDEEKKEKREKQSSDFTALLKEVSTSVGESAPLIPIDHTTRWVEIRPKLEDLKDERFSNMDENDRRNVFLNIVNEMKREEDARRREEDEKRRQFELDRRNEFKQAILARVKAGEITATCRWRDKQEVIESWEEFKTFTEKLPASMAREVFDGVVDQLQRDFRSDRRHLRDLLDDAKYQVSRDSTLLDFIGALAHEAKEKARRRLEEREGDPPAEDGPKADHNTKETTDAETEEEQIRSLVQGAGALERIPQQHMKLYFEELHSRAVQMWEEDQRRKKKREDRYVYLLEDYYYRSDHVGVNWDDAVYDLKRHSAYQDLSTERRKELFDEYMAKLEQKLGKKVFNCGQTRPDSRNDKEKKRSDSMNDQDDAGERDEDEEVEEGELSVKGDEDNQSERSHKREKKSKKKKKRKRSHSRSGSSSDDSDSEGKKKKKKKDKEKKRHKKRSRSRSRSGSEHHNKEPRE